MGESEVLYDISRGVYQWMMPGFGLIFVVVSILSIIVGKFIYKDDHRILDPSRERLFFNPYHPVNKNAIINIPKFILVFALIFTVVSFFFTYKSYLKFNKVYREEKYSVLQGTIDRFIYAEDGEEITAFVVNGKEYIYTNDEIDNLFVGIGSYEGKIKPGDTIQIYYSGKNILRLKIFE